MYLSYLTSVIQLLIFYILFHLSELRPIRKQLLQDEERSIHMRKLNYVLKNNF